VKEQLAKILLAADGTLLDYLENRGLSLSLVRHGRDDTTLQLSARGAEGGH
jgi:hypothetical protein